METLQSMSSKCQALFCVCWEGGRQQLLSAGSKDLSGPPLPSGVPSAAAPVLQEVFISGQLDSFNLVVLSFQNAWKSPREL